MSHNMLELNEHEYEPGTHIGYNIRINDVLTLTGTTIPFNANRPDYWEFTSDENVDKYHLMIDTADF